MDEIKKRKIETEELEEDLTTAEGREVAMEADEIDDVEEGFMKGYEQGEKMAKCALCKKPIYDEAIEKDFDDETYRFCSQHCLDEFEKKEKWKDSEEE